jgi:hypothetical protein
MRIASRRPVTTDDAICPALYDERFDLPGNGGEILLAMGAGVIRVGHPLVDWNFAHR